MKTLRTTCLTLAILAFPAAASAQLVVVGKGQAAQCYQYALTGNTGSRKALEICNAAFDQPLTRRDRAATHVNRGILHMRGERQELAEKDYLAALKINDDLTEAYVNLGASYINQGLVDEAITTLTRALEDVDSPTRASALYNRAIAYEMKGEAKPAYRDLRAAQTLNPDWAAVTNMLSRYAIVKKS